MHGNTVNILKRDRRFRWEKNEYWPFIQIYGRARGQFIVLLVTKVTHKWSRHADISKRDYGIFSTIPYISGNEIYFAFILFNHYSRECANVSGFYHVKSGILFRGAGLVPMMTSSNGNIFRVTKLCAGNSPFTGEFPSQDQWRRALNFFLSAPE